MKGGTLYFRVPLKRNVNKDCPQGLLSSSVILEGLDISTGHSAV